VGVCSHLRSSCIIAPNLEAPYLTSLKRCAGFPACYFTQHHPASLLSNVIMYGGEMGGFSSICVPCVKQKLSEQRSISKKGLPGFLCWRELAMSCRMTIATFRSSEKYQPYVKESGQIRNSSLSALNPQGLITSLPCVYPSFCDPLSESYLYAGRLQRCFARGIAIKLSKTRQSCATLKSRKERLRLLSGFHSCLVVALLM
jgi:hypothetical protein